MLRLPGVVPPGKQVKCGKCTTLFLVPPKQTTLAKPEQPKVTTLAPTANGAAARPVLRLDCPGCKTALKLTGTLPVGKTLKCPKCARPLRLTPRKPAAKTKLVAAPGKKTRLASGPAKKTKLAAGPARPTKLAAGAAPKTQLTFPTQPAKRPVVTAKPQAAPRWVRPVKYGLYVVLAGSVLTLGVVGAGLLGYGPMAQKGDVPASEWKQFVPPEGRCQVQLPGVPSSLRTTADSLGGANSQHFVLLRKDDDIAFKLSFWDRSAAEREKVPFQDLCTKIEHRLRDEVSGIVVKRSDVLLDGHAGKEWHIEPEKGGTLIARVYAANGPAGERIYVLLVGAGRLRLVSGSVSKFFGSFQITSQ